MISSIILGMGLPSTVCYLLLATLIGPVLGQLGVIPLAGHLFIFYFGMMSMVTPPVALAGYAAASIAGTPVMKTSWEAFRWRSWASRCRSSSSTGRSCCCSTRQPGGLASLLSVVVAAAGRRAGRRRVCRRAGRASCSSRCGAAAGCRARARAGRERRDPACRVGRVEPHGGTQAARLGGRAPALSEFIKGRATVSRHGRAGVEGENGCV
jgi:hypothetical protein